MSRTLVFDIESVAFDFDHFDNIQQEYLLKFAESEAKVENEKLKLNLWGLTAQTIAIGLWDLEKGQGKVLYQHPGGESWQNEQLAVEFIPVTEEEMLARFWHGVGQYNRLVTFNGRAFDYPFLLHRSAILGVETNRLFVQEYLKSRYSSWPHCDLLDQLSFYGAFPRRFNLDFYCKSFGITSPKSGGVTGLDMPKLFSGEAYKQIAEYCIGDVIATAKLYERWHRTIDPSRPHRDKPETSANV